MVKLSKKQLDDKVKYALEYMKPGNNATKSKYDANSNVSNTNVATLAAEINKDIDIQVNRYYLGKKVAELFDKKSAKEMYKSINNWEIYSHDESAIFSKAYCVAINLFPFLEQGMTSLGGESKAPHHLASFCGSYVNLIFAISSQFAGACADSSFLSYFHYFAKKDYGNDYLNTHALEIENAFQHIVYSISQPAAARGFQSCFWNISIFDENYFKTLLGNTIMPDGTYLEWEEVNAIQKHFMKWFNKERSKALLTFPVISAALLVKDGKAVDTEFKDFIAEELSEGNSFFIYSSENVNSISQCCRLRSELDMNTFAYTLGSTGLDTGSKKVFTININRMVQDGRDVTEEVKKIHKYLVAYNEILYDMKSKGMMPVYDAGYVTLEKQYLTVGINGIVEAAEYLGYDISDNEPYLSWVGTLLKAISDENKKASKYYSDKFGKKIMFNTEFVPAENVGVKFAKADKKAGYKVNRDCYNSYMFKVEDDSLDFVDKLKMHGREVMQYCDGGSACHLNFKEIPNKEAYIKIIDLATMYGCPYFCTNIPSTCCEECGFINKHFVHSCVKCGSKNISWASRVIGYLKKIKSFSEARQKEAQTRFYH
jgi:ribonucleoside-triphosphate reductase (formate)